MATKSTTTTPRTRTTRATKATASKTASLEHLIPAESFATDYVSRSFAGETDLDILAYAHREKKNVLLYGPTGPGKTSLVLAYAAKHRLPVVTLACNGAVDPSIMFGTKDMDEQKRIFFQESEVVQIIREGGVLYFDEVNFMPGKIAAVVHSLLDKRRQITLLEKRNELVQASEKLFIVGSYNPDYVDTRPLNQAFKNRFEIKMKFGYLREVEEQLIDTEPLLDVAEAIRLRQEQGDIDTPVSTNMLITFEELMFDFSFDFAVENFLASFERDEEGPVREIFEMHRMAIESAAQEIIAQVNG